MVVTAEQLHDKIKDQLDAVHVEIKDVSNCGCGTKFEAKIVSPKFDNLPLLEQQRLVNSVIAEEMQEIHAFQMKTLTPAKWEAQKLKLNTNQ